MSKCIFTFFLLCANIPVFATDYFIDLSQHYMSITQFDYYVEKVIDASVEKNCIGYVRVGANNKITPAYFKQGTEQELTAFITRNLGKNLTKKPLIVRVNKIFIHETTYMNKEVGVASISLTFFERDGNRYKELITTCQLMQHNSLEASQAQDLNIANCLTKCFQLLRDRTIAKQIYPKEVADSVVNSNSFLLEDFPITKGCKGTSGLFYTYTDFLYNTMDTTTSFKVGSSKTDSVADMFAILKLMNPKDKREVWGFWDGKKVYAKVDANKYYPLIFENGAYYIWKLPPPTSQELANAQSSMFLASYAFGLIGAGIAGLIIRENQLGKDKVKYYLDYPSAEFILKEQQLVYKAQSYIYASIYNKENTQIEVWSKGQKQATLLPDTYFEFTSGSNERTVELTFKYKDQIEKFTYFPEIYGTKMLYCKINRKDKLEITYSPDYEKAEILERIKKHLTKRAK
jgi:hypothetical protein